MRYFVKSHFRGWVEVTKEHYIRFVENIRENATGIKSDKKAEYIKTVTKIEGDKNEQIQPETI